MRVLIADDERTFAQALAEMMRARGHEVVEVVHSGLDAIRAYRRHKPHVVLMDYAMGRLNGLTACRNILSGDPAGCVLFLSAFSEREDLAQNFSGARGVLQKPIAADHLDHAMRDAIAPRLEAIEAA